MVSTCLWNTPSRCPGTRVATHPHGLISALAVLVGQLFENVQKYLARSLDERGQAEKDVCGGAARGYGMTYAHALKAASWPSGPTKVLQGLVCKLCLLTNCCDKNSRGGASVEQRREVALLLESYLRYAAYSNSGLKPPTAEASSCWMRRRKRAIPPGMGVQ